MREKEGYRDALDMLGSRFPDRIAISVKEAAAATGLNESTIRDAIKRKKDPFPSVKVGGRVMVPLTGLARWMC